MPPQYAGHPPPPTYLVGQLLPALLLLHLGAPELFLGFLGAPLLLLLLLRLPGPLAATPGAPALPPNPRGDGCGNLP
jgi:hypothetical protein